MEWLNDGPRVNCSTFKPVGTVSCRKINCWWFIIMHETSRWWPTCKFFKVWNRRYLKINCWWWFIINWLKNIRINSVFDICLITLIPSQTRNTFIVFPIETKSIGNYFINVIHRQEIKPGSSSWELYHWTTGAPFYLLQTA